MFGGLFGGGLGGLLSGGGLLGGGGGGGHGLLGGAGPGGLIGDFLHGLIDGRHGHEHGGHGEDEDIDHGFDDIFGGILKENPYNLNNEIKNLKYFRS